MQIDTSSPAIYAGALVIGAIGGLVVLAILFKGHVQF